MNTRKIAAQVAVEAIANDPAAYDQRTVDAVRTVATEAGVSDFYLSMLPAPEITAHIRPSRYAAYTVSMDGTGVGVAGLSATFETVAECVGWARARGATNV